MEGSRLKPFNDSVLHSLLLAYEGQSRNRLQLLTKGLGHLSFLLPLVPPQANANTMKNTLATHDALTNACGLAYFLHQLFCQMIGSKMVTGVVGFITSLQEET